MTNAIEQTKREMYEALSILKSRIEINYSIKDMMRGADEFEHALETHLEDLRKDIEYWRFLNGNQCDTIIGLQRSLKAMTKDRDELARSNLAGDNAYAAMRQERDDCQLRMTVIDRAYNEQQKKTGTCGQVCGDRGASEQPDAKTMAILGAIVDCQQLVSDWAVYGYRAKKQMKKMAYVLNNNPELRAALDHFEGKA